ncbi:MAG: (d)CMP kinase [Desulforhopalus sp.]
MDEPLEIVTIDGPSGVGKSTVSRKVAAVIGFTYLDTGAMYRAAGWYLQQQEVNLDDEDAIDENLQNFELELFPVENDGCDVRVVVNGRDVSDAVRTPQMAMVASKVSALSVVRRVLTDIQRGFGERGRIVAEGRDTGTVVFPAARYKFFLDARVEERARRRVEQLQSKGLEADPDEILAMTVLRDKNDSERLLAPLRQAEDAVRIDTTTMTINEVVETIVRGVREKQH